MPEPNRLNATCSMAAYALVPATGGDGVVAPAGTEVTLTLEAVPRNASEPDPPDPTIEMGAGRVVVVVESEGVVVVLEETVVVDDAD